MWRPWCWRWPAPAAPGSGQPQLPDPDKTAVAAVHDAGVEVVGYERLPGTVVSRLIAAWRMVQRTTRMAFGVADIAVFFSEHARSETLTEQLIRARTHPAGRHRRPTDPTAL